MSILNPISPANLFVQNQTSSVASTEERQVDLRLEQMVRATVVEGGLDRALLEMNHRQYRAQSDIELQVGQKLTLQVLQTHPLLELKIINDPLAGRLSQLLPLLTQPYDWVGLLDRLSQQSQQQNVPLTTTQVYQQLSQLLQPDGRLPASIEHSLRTLPQQLQQLFLSVSDGQRGPEIPPSALQGQQQAYLYYRSADAASTPSLPQLIHALRGQLTQLQIADGRPLPQVWLTETHQLLAPLQQSLPQLQTQIIQMSELFPVLEQMRQQPNLPPQIAGELERLLLQLNVQSRQSQPAIGRPIIQAAVAQPMAASVQTPAPTNTPASANAAMPVAPESAGTTAVPLQHNSPASAAPAASLSAGNSAAVSGNSQPQQVLAASTIPAAPVVPAEISEGLEKLLVQVRQAQGQSSKLSPDLLGRLEGLLDKIRQLPQMAQAAQPVLPGLEMITGQLTQLVQQGPQHPEGGQLGFLSQLFGFHLEAELLKGKKKEALASLKMSLLSMQKELGEEVEEPLRRLEMFQLCKARLADEQVQFLPLPFNELEEGYLLLEKQRQQEDEVSGEQPLQLSLSLRLSALGNMRVDMLYEKEGLHLRIACEDDEKMTYLQEHLAELEQSIETVPLQGVSFASNAEVPARQLLERLLPENPGMLDERI